MEKVGTMIFWTISEIKTIENIRKNLETLMRINDIIREDEV